jgi:predicted HD phosphohydrolase
LVSDYEDYQGVDALVAMAGFLQYAKDEGLDKDIITITLAHDLGGRKDKLMLPRTSDYSQYAKELA